MRTKRSVRRNVRFYVAIPIKFLFLIVIGIEAGINAIYRLAYGILSLFGLRSVLDYFGRKLAQLDEWLLQRSNTFALSLVGVVLAILLGLDIWKGILLEHRYVWTVLAISALDKLTIVALFKHLWEVYRERLLTYRFIELVYNSSVVAWRNALVWAREINLYVDVMIWIDDWRLRARYSFFGHVWRAARTHRCCMRPRFI